MADIELQDVHKRFGDFIAVKSSSFTIYDGEFFVLLGPSGCGKTTTLRMIAGLELPTSGHVRLAGEDVTFLRASERDIAFVFQLFALYPHMNVQRNLAYPLHSEGVPRKEIRARVREVAQLLHIEPLLKRSVGQLAGGDRQRVALGRAIIRRPKAFLMDEPLGTLDAEFREKMSQELLELHQRIHATTVYVTHDQIEALTLADRIAVMDQGEVLQIGTPREIYRKPQSQFVASFIGSPAMNFLPAHGPLPVGSDQIQLGDISTRMPRLLADAPAELCVGVRPEHLYIDGGPLRGEVYSVEYLGSRQLVTVDTALGRLKVKTPNTLVVKPQEHIGLSLAAEHLVLFSVTSGKAVMSELFADSESDHG